MYCFRQRSSVALRLSLFFFFNDTATTEIYTLSLHDALPISIAAQGQRHHSRGRPAQQFASRDGMLTSDANCCAGRSEEHTSELQSQSNLVCRLLLAKKNNTTSLLLANADVHST